MAYLYDIDNDKILFDEGNNSFYLIPSKLATEIEKLDAKDREQVIEAVIAKKSGGCAVCSQNKSEDDSNTCSRLVLVITQGCNLACKYCYANEGLYNDTCAKIMSFETAKNAIDTFLARYSGGIETIQFFGGEPLMNFPLIKSVCEYCEKLYSEEKILYPIKFSISTNGTLINNETFELFNKYCMSVTVSLDGTKAVNDGQRVFANSNEGTYNVIVDKLNILKERKFPLAVEMTITQAFLDLDEEEQIQFVKTLNNMNIDSIHVVPVMSGEDYDRKITDFEAMSRFMDKVTDYTLSTVNSNEKIFLIKSLEIINLIEKKIKKKHFCNAGITNFAVSAEGNLFPCFMFIDDNETFCMGNVNDAFDSERFEGIRNILKKNTYDSVKHCDNCFAKGICTNCIGNSFMKTGRLDSPDESTCLSQRQMIKRIGYYIARLGKLKKDI